MIDGIDPLAEIKQDGEELDVKKPVQPKSKLVDAVRDLLDDKDDKDGDRG